MYARHSKRRKVKLYQSSSTSLGFQDLKVIKQARSTGVTPALGSELNRTGSFPDLTSCHLLISSAPPGHHGSVDACPPRSSSNGLKSPARRAVRPAQPLSSYLSRRPRPCRMAATTTTTTDTDLNTPLGRESVLSEYFDAPILAIRTSQAMADKDVAILQPTSTTALAAEAPPRTSMDSTNGASGVGRVRSLLRKKRPAEAQAATAAAAAGVGAGAATAPAGKTTPPTAATAPAPGPTPAPAPAKPVSTLTSVTAPPPLTAPSKPSSIAPGPVSAVPSTENEVSPAGAAPADGVLSRDYIARAPSRASKRSSKLAPTAAATAVAAATTSPFVRTSSRASKRSTTRASSRASKSSKKSARAPSRASTAGGTSIYDTASDSSALAARDARASSSSDEDDSGRDGPASFYSPVSRARSARHSRHASLPPARREPEGRASVVGSVRRERAKSISGRSSRTARQSVIGMGGGTFGRGAGTIGPGAVPESEESREFRERGELAVGGLSQKQVKRIGKEECECSWLLCCSSGLSWPL